MSSTTENVTTGREAPLEEPPKLDRRQRKASSIADAASGGIRVILVKIIALGILDALALTAIFILLAQREWLVIGIIVIATGLINWIYLGRRKLPAKYLTPGVIFLLVFQVFVLGYTAYIGFTNYGTGHNGTKEQAVSALMSSALERVEDSPTFAVTVLERAGSLNLLVTDPDGEVSVGNAETPLRPVNDAEFEGDKAVGLDGYETLSFQEIIAQSDAITALAVPASDDPNDGALRTPDGTSGYLYVSTLEYDEAAGTMTDTTTGTVYTDNGTGAFTADDGEQLLPGW
ncbi:MAG: maltose ABC transporter permease, partial [Microterricola sp.]